MVIDSKDEGGNARASGISVGISPVIEKHLCSLIVAAAYSPVEGLSMQRNAFDVCATGNQIVKQVNLVVVGSQVERTGSSLLSLVG